jgi:hypothetical protein
MPHGTIRAQKSSKAIEQTTVEACLAIAQRIARAHYLANDKMGWAAATQVARSIEEELLGRTSQNRPLGPAAQRLSWKPYR